MKSWACFVCERKYAELEEAETCERGHARPLQSRVERQAEIAAFQRWQWSIGKARKVAA